MCRLTPAHPRRSTFLTYRSTTLRACRASPTCRRSSSGPSASRRPSSSTLPPSPPFRLIPAIYPPLIRFTQAKLGFNHGWLVQAEAPPGALFGSFKALLESEDVPAHDVAFYFVHWLTDLAGAEPSSGGPMCGLLYTYP